MDTRTRTLLVAGGAGVCLLGAVLLNWLSVNLLFARVGAGAWQAGGVHALAPLLAVALAAGAGLLLRGESAPVRVPPVGMMGAAALLGLLALLPILQGQAGPGAFVTLVGAGIVAFAANGLRDAPQPRRRPDPRPAPPAASAAAFCGSCGAGQQGGNAFCAQCGARLR